MATPKELSDITQRSKFFFSNTMLCLLKALQEKRITVDIRNDSVIEGKLDFVDATMGLSMSRVVMTSVKGQKTPLEQFYIQGRHIRYVHIPDEVNIIETMRWQLNKADHFQKEERNNRNKIFTKMRNNSQARFNRGEKNVFQQRSQKQQNS